MKSPEETNSGAGADCRASACSVPVWVRHNIGLQTVREFKSLKRQQLKAVIAAMEDFKIGCAYVAGYNDGNVESIAEALRNLKREMSCKKWGR